MVYINERSNKNEERLAAFTKAQEELRLEASDPYAYQYPPVSALSSVSPFPSASWSFPHVDQAHAQRTNYSYVLGIQVLPDGYAASFSNPSNCIAIVDKTTLKLVTSWNAHDGNNITGLKSFLDGGLLVSSGTDGIVNIWDPRTDNDKASVSLINPKQRAILSFDVSSNSQTNGLLLVAGSEYISNESSIFIWDVRNPPPYPAPTSASSWTSTNTVWSHTSTHSEDITNVHFRPSSVSGDGLAILSSSTDGLLSISDPMEQDEEEAVKQIGNFGAGIGYCGWSPGGVGSQRLPSNQVWAVSDMETASVWNDELDLVRDYGPINRIMNPDWISSYFIDGIHFAQDGPVGPWGIKGLCMFVGSNIESFDSQMGSGDLALLTIEGAEEWRVHGVLQSGKRTVIRSIAYDPQHGVLIGGCEDSRICLWNFTDSIEDQERGAMSMMELDVPTFGTQPMSMPGGDETTTGKKRGRIDDDSQPIVYKKKSRKGT